MRVRNEAVHGCDWLRNRARVSTAGHSVRDPLPAYGEYIHVVLCDDCGKNLDLEVKCYPSDRYAGGWEIYPSRRTCE